MENVLISYNSKKSDLAESVANQLTKEGFHIHLNDPVLSNYSDYKKDLKTKIANTDIFIVIISPIYNEEESNHFFNEIEFLKNYIENTDQKKLLIPVVQEEASEIEAKIFRNYQVLQFSNIDSTSQIITKISRIINGFIGKKIASTEKDSAIKEKIQSTSSEYVQETIVELKEREMKLRKKADAWYFTGYVSTVLAIMSAGAFFLIFFTNDRVAPFNTAEIIISSLKSIIIVLLFIAASKYSFDLAKSYMNESLKNSDRIHAISFGRFYMRVFGENVGSDEIMKVFQYWNISTNSSFSNLNSDSFDPSLIEQALKIIDSVKAINSKQ